MSVKEEQALVFRERNLYKIAAEDWALCKSIEVDTGMNETLVAKKELWFEMLDGKLAGGLDLSLAQGVDPSTVEARSGMALRRRGAAAVSRLEDEPWATLEVWEFGEDQALHPANNGGRVTISRGIFWEDEAYNPEAFLKEHLVDGHLLIEVDLEVAVRGEQLGKARVRLETFAGQINDLSDHHNYKLVCEEKVFPCHKAILAARSPVVARGLAQGEHMGRSVREAWQVQDSNPAAVGAMLNFIYDTDVPEMEEEGMAVELLKLADFFEVLELKAAAKDQILRQLSASNALRALVEVDLHVKEDERAARGAVFGYIMVHIKQVLASEDWGMFVKSGCHSALITEIVAAMAEHRD